jgi:serine/threonine protein kinase
VNSLGVFAGNRGSHYRALRFTETHPTAGLTSGTKLGPYEIQEPLGAGGMGKVYRARDTRLGRDVAVKVTPAYLSSNPELKQPMEREAREISSLNHPHICTFHDIGSLPESSSTSAFLMACLMKMCGSSGA